MFCDDLSSRQKRGIVKLIRYDTINKQAITINMRNKIREREREREREKETQRETETDRERQRQRQRDRETVRQ